MIPKGRYVGVESSASERVELIEGYCEFYNRFCEAFKDPKFRPSYFTDLHEIMELAHVSPNTDPVGMVAQVKMLESLHKFSAIPEFMNTENIVYVEINEGGCEVSIGSFVDSVLTSWRVYDPDCAMFLQQIHKQYEDIFVKTRINFAVHINAYHDLVIQANTDYVGFSQIGGFKPFFKDNTELYGFIGRVMLNELIALSTALRYYHEYIYKYAPTLGYTQEELCERMLRFYNKFSNLDDAVTVEALINS